MQWTIEGTDGLTGPYPLLCESRQALTEAIEEWLRFDLVQSWAESVSRDRQSRQEQQSAAQAIACNTVAKDIEGM